jgi:hypothetical protein
VAVNVMSSAEREASAVEAPDSRLIRWIRVWLVVVMAGLVLSGLTAFPLLPELRLISEVLHAELSPAEALAPGLVEWIDRVAAGLEASYGSYPFIAYGTDWLAFAHLVIAVAFIGPYRDPVRNVWVVHWGMVCCLGIVPLALIAGAVRGLPPGWQVIDISFGVAAIIPLLIVHRLTRELERRGEGVSLTAAGPAAST